MSACVYTVAAVFFDSLNSIDDSGSTRRCACIASRCMQSVSIRGQGLECLVCIGVVTLSRDLSVTQNLIVGFRATVRAIRFFLLIFEIKLIMISYKKQILQAIA